MNSNKEKGRGAGTPGPCDTRLEHRHFPNREAAAQAVAELDQRIGALIVRASNKDYSLHITSGQTGKPIFVVTRWGWARDFDSLQAVESWLDRVVGVQS